MLRLLIFRNFFSKIFRKTKWAAPLIRPKLRFVHLPPKGKAIIIAIIKRHPRATLQKRAVQGKRGFCAASLLYVNEQAKTQARHSYATLFKRRITSAFINIAIRHTIADPTPHTNPRLTCTPPRGCARLRRT